MSIKTSIVLGSQFGDEGKGNFTAHLSHLSTKALVVRFNGGHQAGHHVVHGDKKHIFYDLADIFYQEALKILGERNIILPSSGQVPMQIAQRLVGSHGAIQDVGEPRTRWFASTEELGKYLHQQEHMLVEELSKTPRYFEW